MIKSFYWTVSFDIYNYNIWFVWSRCKSAIPSLFEAVSLSSALEARLLWWYMCSTKCLHAASSYTGCCHICNGVVTETCSQQLGTVWACFCSSWRSSVLASNRHWPCPVWPRLPHGSSWVVRIAKLQVHTSWQVLVLMHWTFNTVCLQNLAHTRASENAMGITEIAFQTHQMVNCS